MIDWLFVGSSALWIVGLSLALSVLAIAYYHAMEDKLRLGRVLAGFGYRLALDVGMVFICVGMAATSQKWWQIALWLVLLVLTILQIVLETRKKIILDRNRSDGDGDDGAK